MPTSSRFRPDPSGLRPLVVAPSIPSPAAARPPSLLVGAPIRHRPLVNPSVATSSFHDSSAPRRTPIHHHRLPTLDPRPSRCPSPLASVAETRRRHTLQEREKKGKERRKPRGVVPPFQRPSLGLQHAEAVTTSRGAERVQGGRWRRSTHSRTRCRSSDPPNSTIQIDLMQLNMRFDPSSQLNTVSPLPYSFPFVRLADGVLIDGMHTPCLLICFRDYS